MKPQYAIMLAALFGLAGCTSTMSSAVDSANQKMEAQGSPFRYVAQGDSAMVLTLLPLPAGPTKAIPPLAKQALDSISKEEARKGRSTANLEEVRHLQDGREVWVLNTLGDGIAYVVAFEAPSKAGSNIRMKGPFKYLK